MPLLSSINITALEHRALERRNANTSQGAALRNCLARTEILSIFRAQQENSRRSCLLLNVTLSNPGSYWAHPDVLLHVAQRFIGASQGYLRPAGEYTDRSRRSTAVNDLHAVRTPADVFRTYCRVNILSFPEWRIRLC